jgi:hypothetical protein
MSIARSVAEVVHEHVVLEVRSNAVEFGRSPRRARRIIPRSE